MRPTGETIWDTIFTILGAIVLWILVKWLAGMFAVPAELIQIIGIVIFVGVIYNLWLIWRGGTGVRRL